jgi:hypothetical protein
MEKEKLELITQTVDGNEVRDLVFKKVDNIIRGFVKDSVCGLASRDYFRVCTWRLNGTLTPTYGGNNRRDLYLDLSNINK